MRALLAITLTAAACTGAPQAGPPRLSDVWTVEGLSNPESVHLSADGQFLYVSNVAGEAGEHDGEGFISRLTLDGEIETLRWVDGLDAPKGVAEHDGRLYVSDIDHIIEIGIDEGAVLRRIPAPDAVFLNDVAVTEDGRVFVSDSGTARIYELVGDTVEIFIESEAELAGVNGVLPDGERLLVASMDTGELAAIDLATRSFSVIAGGMENADGIGRAPRGGFIVTSWPGRIYWVDEARGEAVELADTTADEIYMNDFTISDGVIYMPHWRPSTVTAHRIE